MKNVARENLWAEKYPELGTAPLPTEPYVSEAYSHLERDRGFRKCWLYVGRSEDVPEAGD